MAKKKTLDEIVRGFMVKQGIEQEEHKYQRYLFLALEGLRDMHYDVSGVPKFAELDVDDTSMSADLPVDYIQYTRVYYVDGKGNIVDFTRNEDLQGADYQCGTYISPTSNGDQELSYGIGGFGVQEYISTHYRNGENIGRFFGLGNSPVTTYKIDDRRGVVQLGGRVPHKVFIEYIASPDMQGANYVVHPYIAEPIEFYISWQNVAFKDTVSENIKKKKETDYVNKKYKALKRMTAFNLRDAVAASRQYLSQTPRL